jgi:hypothetical protein
MSETNGQVTIATFDCALTELLAYTATSTRAETVFAHTEALTMRVTVEFLGSGSIALLALKPPIQVEFFAKAIGAKQLSIGHILLDTAPKQFRYEASLIVSQGLGSIGFLPEKVYQLSALLRVGCPNYPAIVTGFIKGRLIQTYNQQ